MRTVATAPAIERAGRVAPLSHCVSLRPGYFLKVTLRMLLMTAKPPTVEVTHRGSPRFAGTAAQSSGCTTAGMAKRTW